MVNGENRLSSNGACRSLEEPFGSRDAVLVTNDDGLDPGGALVLDLAREMVNRGHRVVVCAPGKNNSACGQKITLDQSMRLRRHVELEVQYGCGTGNLFVFSMDEGSPADCVIVAIEPSVGLLARLGMRPIMTLSGVNLGPNLGPDVIYSGTFAAARQAAMYGVPGMASSLASMGDRALDPDYARSCNDAVNAAATMAEILLRVLESNPPNPGRMESKMRTEPRIRSASSAPDDNLRSEFAAGNVVVSLNVPPNWKGQYEPCRLDNVLYRGAVRFDQDTLPRGDADSEAVTIMLRGGRLEEMGAELSDTQAVGNGRASVSTLSTWPPTHPLAVASVLLEDAFRTSARARLPSWIEDYATLAKKGDGYAVNLSSPSS
jgi:5'/3'-nucleotidase SurE